MGKKKRGHWPLFYALRRWLMDTSLVAVVVDIAGYCRASVPARCTSRMPVASADFRGRG